MTKERLPPTRPGHIHRGVIAGEHKVYIRTGLYEDGRLGEIFIKVDKRGSTMAGMCNAWAIAVSMMLQEGIRLEKIVEKFAYIRFEPNGFTDNDDVELKNARSIVDYVVRWLAKMYLEDEVGVSYDRWYADGKNDKHETRAPGA
jgi:ribonucleoside-diphosphate reductase alpha chain